jgi:hypothetical protein
LDIFGLWWGIVTQKLAITLNFAAHC